MLVDMEWKGTAAQGDAVGQSQRLLLRARSRDGTVPDRASVRQANWNVGFDENGRPIKNPNSGPSRWAGSSSTRARRVAPTGIRRRTARERDSSTFRRGRTPAAVRKYPTPASGRKGSGTRDRRRRLAHDGDRRSRVAAAGDLPERRRRYGAIRALDPKTGEKKWDFKMVNYTESGVLSTAGDLVFGGGMDGTSSRSTQAPANCCGTSISAARMPAAPSATPSTASNMSSAPAQARCSCSRCPTTSKLAIRGSRFAARTYELTN